MVVLFGVVQCMVIGWMWCLLLCVQCVVELLFELFVEFIEGEMLVLCVWVFDFQCVYQVVYVVDGQLVVVFFDVVDQVGVEGVVIIGWVDYVVFVCWWDVVGFFWGVDDCIFWVVGGDVGFDLVYDLFFILVGVFLQQVGFVVVDYYVVGLFDECVQFWVVEQWYGLVWVEDEWNVIVEEFL